jgi:hypothetical protein
MRSLGASKTRSQILQTPWEDLYTNPPNSRSSNTNSGGNDEQDRQKFEGTLSSFYATRNATAEHLTRFVAAVAAAVDAETRSLKASQALFEFPVDPEDPSSNVFTEIIVTGLGVNSPSGINFGVPAAFFYAHGASMDKNTRPDRRYQIACGDRTDRVLQAFGTAITAGVLNGNATTPIGDPDNQPFVSQPAATPVTSAQAARRLAALGVPPGSGTTQVAMPSPVSASGSFANVVQAWLAGPPIASPTWQNYQTTMDGQIWAQIATNGEQNYLALVLVALTQNYIDPKTNQTLADLIANGSLLQPKSVKGLKSITDAQWPQFFTTTESVLPSAAFTQAGAADLTNPPPNLQASYINTRIQAFIRGVQHFFTISSVPNSSSPPPPGAPASFGLPPFDAIRQAVGFYEGTGSFTFGASALDPTQLTAAVQQVFPDDPVTQRWLFEAMEAINQLFQVANVVPELANPNDFLVTPSLRFSIVEALYARGFRSAKDIAVLSGDDFQQALTGTVAYATRRPRWLPRRNRSTKRRRVWRRCRFPPRRLPGRSSRSTTGRWSTAFHLPVFRRSARSNTSRSCSTLPRTRPARASPRPIRSRPNRRHCFRSSAAGAGRWEAFSRVAPIWKRRCR